MEQLRPLVLGLVAVAAIFYVGGIAYAGYASITSQGPPVIPEFVTQLVTVIGGALGTHFGAIFGISQLVSPKRVAGLAVFTRSTVRTAAASEAQPQPSTKPMDTLQVLAAYFYVIALVVGTVLWGIDGFSPTAADILKNVAYSLLGVLGGVVAVALNVRR